MKILFLVGKQTDFYPKKYTSRSAPMWMKREWENYEEFLDTDDHLVPADVAIAMYLSYKHPRDTIDCFLGYEVISKKILDKYDVVYVIYDAIEVFHCGGREKTCPKDAKKLERAVKTTSAFVYPYPSFHKYIIDKPKYYADLRRANIPVVPFFRSTPRKVLSNLSNFRNRVERKGWKGVIVKPSYAGYSSGIKVYKNFSQTRNSTLKKNFQTLEKLGFPGFTVAEFVPSFGSHFEIRTYWINNKYAYSVGTLTASVGKNDEGLQLDDEDTFKAEGGRLPNELRTKLKTLARKVIKALPQYPYGQPFLRIDFGCCIETLDKCPENYFVNEVETLAANMLPADTKFPVVERTGNVLYKFAKKVQGKSSNIRPKKSTYRNKSITCIKNKNPKQNFDL